jgi:hypothetical protein
MDSDTLLILQTLAYGTVAALYSCGWIWLTKRIEQHTDARERERQALRREIDRHAAAQKAGRR